MQNNNIIVRRIVCGLIQNNTYIVHNKNNTQCVVIDPAETDLVQGALAEYALNPTMILLTHGHFDHIMGVDFLRKEYKIPVAIHKHDNEMLLSCDKSLVKKMMQDDYTTSSAENILNDGDIINTADMAIHILHTPGHTRGGVCYEIENNLFTGDTLFKNDAGRTDFEGGSAEQLMTSLQKLFDLSGDYNVFPGHGETTLLSVERVQNSFVQYMNGSK